MKVSDEELMVMFSAGTAAAFSMLYDRYRHRVYRFAVACLESAADAEDAVQEVFIRVARAATATSPQTVSSPGCSRFQRTAFAILGVNGQDIRHEILRSFLIRRRKRGTAAASSAASTPVTRWNDCW